MHEFTVQTGKLKITIISESAHEAALEAVQVWEAIAVNEKTASDAAHRANLDPVTVVRKVDRRVERRFPTFNLLAQSRGESANTAWERVLGRMVGGVN